MENNKLPNKLQMANDIKQLKEENKKLRNLLKQKQTEIYQLKQELEKYTIKYNNRISDKIVVVKSCAE